jgi:hypothetical protein
MLAKMMLDAFSGSTGCKALKKTCGKDVVSIEATGRREILTDLDDELQALNVALLGGDELVTGFLAFPLTIRQVGQS